VPACPRKSWASARKKRCPGIAPGWTDAERYRLDRADEAFAAQSLAVIQDLGLDPAKVNPLGGAIALGHPLGATGAIRTATLLHGMRRHKQKYGIVTMCIGTGMGAAAYLKLYK